MSNKPVPNPTAHHRETTNVRLSGDIKAEAKRQAAIRKMSLAQYVEELIKRDLGR